MGLVCLHIKTQIYLVKRKKKVFTKLILDCKKTVLFGFVK